MVKLARLDESHLLFICPACNCPHHVRVAGLGPVWTWNGSTILPTFYPSIVFNGFTPSKRCHCEIRDGAIEFFADSHHEMAGKTAWLPDWPEQPVAPENEWSTK
jgi:hypothetical protein